MTFGERDCSGEVYDPAGHGLHDVDPSVDEYPTSQLSQDTEPDVDENVPAGHELQELIPNEEYFPAMHCVQEVSVEWIRPYPALHWMALLDDIVGSREECEVCRAVGLLEGTLLKHCDAPMNMVCVDVKRVFTSAEESTLLYIRKSFKPPFKSGFSNHQLLLPK